VNATHLKDKVNIVPFCEFEKIYAASKGVDLWSYPTIYPLGLISLCLRLISQLQSTLGDFPPKGDPSFEAFIKTYDTRAFGPEGDRWAGRSVTDSDDMSDSYYINHYQNEQVGNQQMT